MSANGTCPLCGGNMKAWNGDGERACDTCGWPEIGPDEALRMLQEFVDEAYAGMGVANRGHGKCKARLDDGSEYPPQCDAWVRVHDDVIRTDREDEFLERMKKKAAGAWSLGLNGTRRYLKVTFW